jgi:hypothetical protein
MNLLIVANDKNRVKFAVKILEALEQTETKRDQIGWVGIA